MKTAEYFGSYFLILFMFSCNQDQNSTMMDKLETKLNGEWIVVNAEGDFSELNKGTIYTFIGLQQLETKKSIFSTKGAITSVTESHLSVQMEGLQNPSEFDFRFEGSDLILEPMNSGQILTLLKK
ncbi:MAG: hypothetical protein JXR53_04565 [Bacteroidales bacterium]|nr:hypothetical protein [Bacteroidales bacterium]